MSSEEASNQNSKKTDTLTAIVDMILKVVGIFLMFTFKQITNRKNHNVDFLLWFSLCVAFSFVSGFAANWPLFYILAVFGHYKPVTYVAGWVLTHYSRFAQMLIVFLPTFYLFLFFRHLADAILLKRYQRAFDHLGMQTHTKLKLKAIDVIRTNSVQKTILAEGFGLDIEKLKDKKGALESGLNLIVHEIRTTKKNRGIFEILTSEKDLPLVVPFEEIEHALTAPYTFVVGESMEKLITMKLGDMQHMLIAGATNNGKSVFFKQTLVGLLKSSKNIQMYLIDLKRGIDMKPFEKLSNVRLTKDQVGAIKFLSAVNDEMEERFKYLEKNSFTEIDP